MRGTKRAFSRKLWQKTFLMHFWNCWFRLVQNGKMLWQSVLRATISLCCCCMQIQEELQCPHKTCPLKWIYNNTAELAMIVKTLVSSLDYYDLNVYALMFCVKFFVCVFVSRGPCCLSKVIQNSEEGFQRFTFEPLSAQDCQLFG